MNLLHAFILGLVQGATEYIPVSSSAHLVLVPWFLGWPDPSFEFEVLVQWGTLVGLFIFFWEDIWVITKGVLEGLYQRKPLATFESKIGWMVFVATIPAVVLGLLFKDLFASAFSSPGLAGGFLILTAILLVVAESYGARLRKLEEFTWLDSIIVGLWQAAAILPGISRSGSTIGGAVLRNFSRPAAARFSFLMSIPALLGAGMVALFDLMEAGSLSAELPSISVGFIAAAISGYVCIRWLLYYLQKHSLYVFAAYCTLISFISLTLYFSGY